MGDVMQAAAGEPNEMSLMVPGVQVDLATGNQTDVDVCVDLPSFCRLAHTRNAVTFEHYDLSCRFYKRTWYWYLKIGNDDPVRLHMSHGMTFERALWKGVQYIEARYYNNGARRPANDGWIYVVSSNNGGPIKIGYATDVAARICNLQVGHPDTLDLLYQFRGTKEVERALHDALAAYHVRGEWFDRSFDVVFFLECVADAEREEGIDPLMSIAGWVECGALERKRRRPRHRSAAGGAS